MIKDPSTALCLEYDGINAPILSAFGEDTLAEEILKLAKEHNIPIYENPELVKSLSQLSLGEEIPQELYLIIAQLIAFVYNLKGKIPSQPKAQT